MNALGAPLLVLAPALLLDHLPQIGDIRRCFFGRKIAARDRLGFGKAALQSDDERKVLPHLLFRALLLAGPAQSPSAFGKSFDSA